MKKKIFNILIIFVYATITFLVVLKHEPWRDEIQAWYISKNLSILDIFQQLKYERTSMFMVYGFVAIRKNERTNNIT